MPTVSLSDIHEIVSGCRSDLLQRCSFSFSKANSNFGAGSKLAQAPQPICLPQSVLKILGSPSARIPEITKYHGFAASKYWQRTASFFVRKYDRFTSIECIYWFLFDWPGHLGVPKQLTKQLLDVYQVNLGGIALIPPVYWIWKLGRSDTSVDSINTSDGLYGAYLRDKNKFLGDCVAYNVCPSLYSGVLDTEAIPISDVRPSSRLLRISRDLSNGVNAESLHRVTLRAIFEVAIANPNDPRPVFSLIPESVHLFRGLEVVSDGQPYPFFPLLCWMASRPIEDVLTSASNTPYGLPGHEDLVHWFVHVWCLCHPAHILLVDASSVNKFSPSCALSLKERPVDIVANWDGLGLSKNAEMTLDALVLSGMTTRRLHIVNGYLDPSEPELDPAQVIFHVNADDCVELLLRQHAIVPGRFMRPRLLGFFLWELEEIPLAHELGCELIDLIMLPSKFLLKSYNQYHDKTVVVGKSVVLPEPKSTVMPLEADCIESYSTRFLLIFDSGSGVERKNPYPVVKAFEQLYGGSTEVCLVVKASRPPLNHWGDPFGQYERICTTAGNCPNILLIDRRLSDEEIFGLVHACHVIVSSHRGEGFGYLMSYAALARKQLIATNYSGIAEEICDAGLPWLPLDYELIPPPLGKFFHEMDSALWADTMISDIQDKMAEAVACSPHWTCLVSAYERQFASLEQYYSMNRYAQCLLDVLSLSAKA